MRLWLPKKLHIKTFGCQMNEYDSVRMAETLAPIGYAPCSSADEADLVIVNTCHIREKASEKLFSELGRLRALRDERGGRPLVAVAGCVAQAAGEDILARAPYVDLVVGPQAYHRLPELAARAEHAAALRGARTRAPGLGALDVEFPVDSKFDHLPQASQPRAIHSFLAVQEGCDKFCAYCVVPYTRGAEYSRPVDQVIAEAEAMVALGAREIMLLGQNVNAYHGDGPDGKTWGLGRLIRRLAEIDGLARLIYTTSHPKDMDEDLIAAHGDCDKLAPWLHLPVQSGSNRVLAAMNRGHEIDVFRRAVDRLRAVRPDIALSSDFIAGHPGEREEDHQATLRLIEDTRFAQAYSFKYSARPGTPAAGAPEQVAEEVKDRRLQDIQALLRQQQTDFNRSCVGRTLDVLFDREGRHDGQIVGRSPFLQPVHVPLEGRSLAALMGQMVPVRIVEDHPNSLRGALSALESAA